VKPAVPAEPTDSVAFAFDGVTKVFPGRSRRTLLRRAVPGRFGDLTGSAEPAVDQMHLEVPIGQALGIVGPNGAGKSTMLRMLAGIQRPTAGTIRRQGRLASVIELGAVVHREMTGTENLMLLATMLGLSREQAIERLPSMQEFTGLGEALEYPVREYSTGMAARLGFGAITHFDADILAIDEALAVGDREFQERCFAALRGHVDRGGTLVLVTHDLWPLTQLCDRVVTVRSGRLIDDGDPREVIERYLELEAPQPTMAGGVTIRSLEPDRPGYDASTVVRVSGEVEVDRTLPDLEAELEMSVPPFGLWGRVRCPLSPGRVPPGRYQVSFTFGPIPFQGQATMATEVFLRTRERSLAVATATFALHEGRAAKTLLAMKTAWSFEPAGDRTALVHAEGVRGEAATVEVRDVTKRYPPSRASRRRGDPRAEVVALDGVQLSAYPGEMLGIIGPNGSGKSTLLRVIGGITAPDHGEVEVNGTSMALIELGLGFHDALDGYENLRLSWSLLGLSSADLRQVVDEIVHFSGLSERMTEPIRQWSTGMRARLSLSLALHSGADLLLIDEALAVGDVAFRATVIDRLQALVASGCTALFVSHDLRMVRQLCNRVVRLEEGGVVADGSASEIIEHLGGVDWEGTVTATEADLQVSDLDLRPPQIDVHGVCEVSFRVRGPHDTNRQRVEFYLCDRFSSDWVRSGTTGEIYDRAVAMETVPLPEEADLSGNGLLVRVTLGPLPLRPSVVDVVVLVVDEADDQLISEVRRPLRIGRAGGGRPGLAFQVDGELVATGGG